MKDFDLKAAKAGAAVCMRNGKPVRIICTDRVSSKYPVVVLVPDREYEDVEVYTATGKYGVKDFVSDDDLMMRDDDYAEKLARGEYGKHIDEATETDREYLRRELSEKIMVAMIRELAGKSPHSTSNNITVFEAMAADAVSYAEPSLRSWIRKNRTDRACVTK